MLIIIHMFNYSLYFIFSHENKAPSFASLFEWQAIKLKYSQIDVLLTLFVTNLILKNYRYWWLLCRYTADTCKKK